MFLSDNLLLIIMLLTLFVGSLIADHVLNKKSRLIDEKIHNFVINRLTVLSVNKNINKIIINNIPEECYLQAFFLIEKISQELNILKQLFSFDGKLSDVLIVFMNNTGEINYKDKGNCKDIYSHDLLFILHKHSNSKKLAAQLKKWNKTFRNEDDWLDFIMDMTVVELLLFFSPTIIIR